MIRLGAAIGLLALAAPPAASAEPFRSVYQDITLRTCRDLNPTPPDRRGDHATVPVRCPPFAGYGVAFVFYPNLHTMRIDPPGGTSADAQLRFRSGLGKRLEWRGPARGKGIEPRAAIVRVGHSDRAGAPASLLAILKVSPEAICWVGVVDARAKDANVQARRAADEMAQDFACDRDRPMVFGTPTPAAQDFLEQAF